MLTYSILIFFSSHRKIKLVSFELIVYKFIFLTGFRFINVTSIANIMSTTLNGKYYEYNIKAHLIIRLLLRKHIIYPGLMQIIVIR